MAVARPSSIGFDYLREIIRARFIDANGPTGLGGAKGAGPIDSGMKAVILDASER